MKKQTFQQAPSIDIGKLPQTPTAGWDSANQEHWAGRMRGR